MQNTAHFRKKERVFFEVIHTVFRMEIVHGHLKWRVADLARSAGVSRSLVYHYLGRSKLEILLSAIELIWPEFYGLTESRQKKGFMASVLLSKDLSRRMPFLTCFYYSWILRENTLIGKKLLQYDHEFELTMRKAFPQLDDQRFWLFRAVLHGVVTGHFLTNSQATQIIELALSR